MRISDWSSDVCSSDLLREDPVLTAALALLRRGERHGTGGGVTLVGAPAVIARLGKAKEWIALLERRRGGTVTLRADNDLAISSYYAEYEIPRLSLLRPYASTGIPSVLQQRLPRPRSPKLAGVRLKR